MNFLSGLIGNKSIMRSLLGGLKGEMQKEGASMICITAGDDNNPDTPGLDIKMVKGEAAILTGEDLERAKILNKIYEGISIGKLRSWGISEEGEIIETIAFSENDARRVNRLMKHFGPCSDEDLDIILKNLDIILGALPPDLGKGEVTDGL
jgi:hypothetical protein